MVATSGISSTFSYQMTWMWSLAVICCYYKHLRCMFMHRQIHRLPKTNYSDWKVKTWRQNQRTNWNSMIILDWDEIPGPSFVAGCTDMITQTYKYWSKQSPINQFIYIWASSYAIKLANWGLAYHIIRTQKYYCDLRMIRRATLLIESTSWIETRPHLQHLPCWVSSSICSCRSSQTTFVLLELLGDERETICWQWSC
jgi:hypothetical protein